MKEVVAYEEWQARTIMTPRGPVFANKGDVVIVVVAKDWTEGTRALVQISQSETEKPGG